jgi:NAD dependent epimerase/dehydratase family enzyme
MFRRGFGIRVGRGNQWVSWIALSDAVHAILHVLGSTLSGAVNVVSPNPVTNLEYADTLASVLRRPRLLVFPPGLVRRYFGAGLADEVLLASARVLPTKLLTSGFRFEQPALRGTLQNLLLPVT